MLFENDEVKHDAPTVRSQLLLARFKGLIQKYSQNDPSILTDVVRKECKSLEEHVIKGCLSNISPKRLGSTNQRFF